MYKLVDKNKKIYEKLKSPQSANDTEGEGNENNNLDSDGSSGNNGGDDLVG